MKDTQITGKNVEIPPQHLEGSETILAYDEVEFLSFNGLTTEEILLQLQDRRIPDADTLKHLLGRKELLLRDWQEHVMQQNRIYFIGSTHLNKDGKLSVKGMKCDYGPGWIECELMVSEKLYQRDLVVVYRR